MKISKLYNKIVKKFGVCAFVNEDKSLVTENTEDVVKYLNKKKIKYSPYQDSQWIIINQRIINLFVDLFFKI